VATRRCAELDAPSYKVVPLEGRGLGAVATRKLQPGELIITETPVLAYGDDFGPAELERQFSALDEETRESVLALHDSYMLDGEKSLEGIVRTNSYARNSDSADGLLCPRCSRFNHSCSPNCEQSYNEEASEMRIYASSEIEAGTELCVFYTEVRQPRAERLQALQASFGFVCRCDACSAPSRESDDRRRRLLEIDEQVAAMAAEDPERGIDMMHEMFQLLDKEGLHLNFVRKRGCFNAYQLSFLCGKKSEATDWVVKAYEFSMLSHGPLHPDTVTLASYVKDPLSLSS